MTTKDQKELEFYDEIINILKASVGLFEDGRKSFSEGHLTLGKEQIDSGAKAVGKVVDILDPKGAHRRG